MIDSVSDIILLSGDATPKNIILRTLPAPRNPQNFYPTAAQVALGVSFGASPEYQTGTLVGAGGSAVYRVVGSPVVRRLS
jgi:hypothetical protein